MPNSLACLRSLLALCLLLVGSAPAYAAGYLHRSHTAIVGGDGHAVLLRGVNLGNWLYIEPWMVGDTHLAMYGGEEGKPDEFEAAVTQLVGPARTAAFYKEWRDHYVTQADIQRIAGWGFNSVRVPLDYRLFDGRDTGFVYLDRLLRWCAASHLYVVLDMHAVPGGKQARVPGSAFTDTQNADRLARVWTRIAARYADNPWVGGYDLVNEPVVWDTPKLRGLYQKLTQAVRAVDPRHLIFVEGDQYGSRLDQLGLKTPADVWDDNLALSDHVYGASQAPERPGADSQYSPYTRAAHGRLAAALDVPLWQGEFGYNSNTWLRRQRDLCEAGDPVPVGWCLWAYKATGTWSLTGFTVPDGYRRLQDYWNRRRRDPDTPRPSAAAAYQALLALARATDQARCTTRRDVVDALTRPDFLTRAVPYRPGLAVPGRIPAMAYDMGAEGVAYHDTVSTDEAGKGPAGRAWNEGWSGRNDGVDLFGHAGLGYVIGGIQPGEWVDYTVTARPGAYALRVRYASPAGGRLHVSLGGADLAGSVSLSATGDWGRFATVTVPGVKVTARGRTTLRLAFDTSGFSIAWVEMGGPPTTAHLLQKGEQKGRRRTGQVR